MWCGTGGAAGTELQLTQSFQEFHGLARAGKATRGFEGRIEGHMLRTTGDAPHSLALELDSGRLRVTASGGRWDALRNASFTRASERNTC
jgi:hypothetical protein